MLTSSFPVTRFRYLWMFLYPLFLYPLSVIMHTRTRKNESAVISLYLLLPFLLLRLIPWNTASLASCRWLRVPPRVRANITEMHVSQLTLRGHTPLLHKPCRQCGKEKRQRTSHAHCRQVLFRSSGSPAGSHSAPSVPLRVTPGAPAASSQRSGVCLREFEPIFSQSNASRASGSPGRPFRTSAKGSSPHAGSADEA